VLWTAGQERVSRENRGRLTELFVGVRDGYLAGLVGAGQATWKGGGDHLPSYARMDVPTVRSPGVRDVTLAKLGVMFPGIVKRTDS
jgi:hypothetical protein